MFFPTSFGSVKRLITLNFQEQITNAEVIWAMTVTQRGYSFKSFDEIGDVFRYMFPDLRLLKNLICS